MTLRVLLVQGAPQLRVVLRRLLGRTAGVEVVGETDDGTDAPLMAARLRVDLVVMDHEIESVDGVEATGRVLAARPEAEVIAFIAAGDADLPARFRAAGARRWFAKDELPALVHCIAAQARSRRDGRDG